MNGAPTRWAQAVSVFEVMPTSGDYGYSIILIHDHKFVFNGKVYG
jgi:hypothetical protein